MKHRIIGIAGLARAGKDTAADYLLKHLDGYAKASFADPIKDMLRVGLGLTEAQLYGDEKDKVDTRYGRTPRHMMQTLGTEWGRNSIHPDTWIRALDSRVDAPPMIPDVRFRSEADYVRERGVLIHVVGRGGIGGYHMSESGVPVLHGDILIRNSGTLAFMYEQLQEFIDNVSE